jgi:hypothetical protein
VPDTRATETTEGLERTLSSLYYSRMRFLTKLLPLLLAAEKPAHITSVFGAGLERLANWHPEDLTLRGPGNFNVRTRGAHSTIMTTLFTEKLLQQHSGKLSFTHVFPGLVVTPAFDAPSHPFWFRAVVFLLLPILKRTIAVSVVETGERMLFLGLSGRYAGTDGVENESTVEEGGEVLEVATGTDGQRGSGTYSCKYDGETNAGVVRRVEGGGL